MYAHIHICVNKMYTFLIQSHNTNTHMHVHTHTHIHTCLKTQTVLIHFPTDTVLTSSPKRTNTHTHIMHIHPQAGSVVWINGPFSLIPSWVWKLRVILCLVMKDMGCGCRCVCVCVCDIVLWMCVTLCFESWHFYRNYILFNRNYHHMPVGQELLRLVRRLWGMNG